MVRLDTSTALALPSGTPGSQDRPRSPAKLRCCDAVSFYGCWYSAQIPRVVQGISRRGPEAKRAIPAMRSTKKRDLATIEGTPAWLRTLFDTVGHGTTPLIVPLTSPDSSSSSGRNCSDCV